MSKTIYVIVGSTGEYSDHTYWFERAFVDGTEAEMEAVALLNRVNKFDKEARWDEDSPGYAAIKAWEEENPARRIDYTGVSYDVVRMELVG